ncbi:hypothetical protein [Salirhabdus sp. Marseille-P4669]|uniref:hypothetical protein n=1 Tax=Salirhabdus sp. Marseille-P4669 TaxID=2042310 RepID=UPI000C7D3FE4|nr:hypothetical protein [Salirhabdus sp. Marseille-P4669]
MIPINFWKVASLLTIVLFICACSKETTENINIVKYKPLDFEIFFVSNDSNTEVERVYIDALLSLQREFASNQMTWDREIINNKETIETITIDQYPSLIIVKNGQVMKKISDNVSKEEIMTNVKHIITND